MGKKKQKRPAEKNIQDLKEEISTDTGKHIRFDKNSVIVLAIASVIFVVAFIAANSGSLMNGVESMFILEGNAGMETEKATVIAIRSEEIKQDYAGENGYVGTQKLAVTVESGRYKGESMEIPKNMT